MGLINIISGIKNWTMENVFGRQEKAQGLPNLGKEIQEMINTKEFERVVDSSGPFVLAALGVWPGYWLYRGFDYHTHRAHIPLPIYIRQTVIQAKLLQLAIILAGIYTVLQEQRSPKNEHQDLDDNDD